MDIDRRRKLFLVLASCLQVEQVPLVSLAWELRVYVMMFVADWYFQIELARCIRNGLVLKIHEIIYHLCLRVVLPLRRRLLRRLQQGLF